MPCNDKSTHFRGFWRNSGVEKPRAPRVSCAQLWFGDRLDGALAFLLFLSHPRRPALRGFCRRLLYGFGGCRPHFIECLGYLPREGRHFILELTSGSPVRRREPEQMGHERRNII
jgi:hypothetical protein